MIDTFRRNLLRCAAGFAAVLPWAGMRTAFPQTDKPADISGHETDSLARMAELLFPHDGLSPAVYHDAVKALLKRAAGDTRFINTLKDGIDVLDATDDARWTRRKEKDQLFALRSIEPSEFFQMVRRSILESLYRDPRVWSIVGYEGNAIQQGGYLHRGFNDIDWLPGP